MHMQKNNILICDDDKDIVEALKIYLSAEGYHIYTAFNGEDALRIIRDEDIHLALMDIMMPLLDGIQATVKLREISNIPVILLTAKSEDADKILGLTIGADDYVTKPFNPVEVVARVKSQLRRYTMLGCQPKLPENSSVITIGGITLDDTKKSVTVDGSDVSLTPIEYNILKFLMENAGCVFPPRRSTKPYGKGLPSAPNPLSRYTYVTCGRKSRLTPPIPAISKSCGGTATNSRNRQRERNFRVKSCGFSEGGTGKTTDFIHRKSTGKNR